MSTSVILTNDNQPRQLELSFLPPQSDPDDGYGQNDAHNNKGPGDGQKTQPL
jgi:hypothetical protein